VFLGRVSLYRSSLLHSVIVERRNELLRELFRMIRTKKEANLISYDSEDEDEDDDDLEAFLAKYNIEKEYAPPKLLAAS
jgi:hypothetical protein